MLQKLLPCIVKALIIALARLKNGLVRAELGQLNKILFSLIFFSIENVSKCIESLVDQEHGTKNSDYATRFT
jgi:hypothetical protein